MSHRPNTHPKTNHKTQAHLSQTHDLCPSLSGDLFCSVYGVVVTLSPKDAPKKFIPNFQYLYAGGRIRARVYINISFVRSQHRTQSICTNAHILSRSYLLGSGRTITTAPGWLGYHSVSPANWLTDLLDPKCGDVRHLLYLSLPCIFSFHAATWSVDFHMVSSSPKEAQYGSLP